MNNYPKIYNNDIKVLGRVVSIATENKVAAAEQIFDEKFNYSDLDNYSWDNADFTKEGLNQYTINRILGRKLKYLDDRIRFDNDGWIIKLLPWKNKVEQDLSSLDARVSILEGCCRQVTEILNNLPTGAGDAQFIVNPKSVNLAPGEKAQINVEKGDDLTGDVRYVSNNGNIATVNSSGQITAVADGTTTITVSVDGFRPTQDVTVTVTTPTPTYRVTFNPNNGQPSFHQDKLEGEKLVAVTDPVKEGYTFNGWHVNSDTGAVWNFNDPVTSTMMLIAGYTQNEAPKYTLTYKDGNATLSTQQYEAGQAITPIADPTKSGYTFNGWSPSVPATMPANDLTVTAQWTQNEQPVEPIRPDSISISGPNAVQVGNTITLTAAITPSNADTDTTITWNSSDPSKATVNNGVVTGVAEGTTTITARTANGKTASHQVTVNPAPTQSPQSITITGAKDLKVGTAATASDKTCTLVATISPAEADQSVTWSSSDNTKATVNNGVVSAISEGSVTITATSTANPQVSDSVTINITLENTPEPTHDEKYKVSWTTGNAHLLHATTDNGARTADWGSAWTADISVDSGYYITGIHVYKQENDVRGEEMTTNASGTNIVHGVGSISIEQMYNDVEIVITTAYNQEVGTWNVDWQGVIDNHGAVDTVAGPHTPHGTVEKNGMINYLVEVNEGYAFAENNPITVTMGGVDVSNDTSKVWYGEHHFDSQDGQATDIVGYNVYLSPVTGDVVITISTVAVEPPTVSHTVSWTFTGDGEHAQLNDVNPSNVSNNSVEVTHGASFTARIDADEDYNAYMYNLQMKDENGDWQNLYTYGTEGGADNYYDPVTFQINVLRVTGDVRFEVYTELKPYLPTSDTLFRQGQHEVEFSPIGDRHRVETNVIDGDGSNDMYGDDTQGYGTSGVKYTDTAVLTIPLYLQDGDDLSDIGINTKYTQEFQYSPSGTTQQVTSQEFVELQNPPEWLNVDVQTVENHTFLCKDANGNQVTFEAPGVQVTLTINPESDFIEAQNSCWITISNTEDESIHSIQVTRLPLYTVNTTNWVGDSVNAEGTSADIMITASRNSSSSLDGWGASYDYTLTDETVTAQKDWISIEDKGYDSNNRKFFRVTIPENNTGEQRSSYIYASGIITVGGVSYKYVPAEYYYNTWSNEAPVYNNAAGLVIQTA